MTPAQHAQHVLRALQMTPAQHVLRALNTEDDGSGPRTIIEFQNVTCWYGSAVSDKLVEFRDHLNVVINGIRKQEAAEKKRRRDEKIALEEAISDLEPWELQFADLITKGTR